MYLSLSAVDAYFQTGVISWGRPPQRATGELALLFHGAFIIGGVWLFAEGLRQLFHGDDPRG